MKNRLLQAVVPAFVLSVLSLAAAAPAAAQSKECQEFMTMMRQSILIENYDDLGALEEGLETFRFTMRLFTDHYDAEALNGMSANAIKENREAMATLLECMPYIRKLLQDIKDRMDQLGAMGSVSTNANTRATARGRRIDDLLNEQARVRDAVADAFRRAGIGG